MWNTPTAGRKANEKVSLTIFSHLIQLIDEGKVTDFRRITTEKDYSTVTSLFASDPDNAFGRLVNEYNIPPHIVRAVLAEQRSLKT